MPRKPRGIGGIIYGDPGIGKSGLAAQFPKPIRGVSCNELGFSDLIDAGEIDEDDIDEEDAEDFKDLLNLTKTSTDVATYIVDGLSGIAQFMQDAILHEVYNGNVKDFGSFSEGWRIHAPIYAQKLEQQLTYLRSKGVNVILIGHKRIDTSKNVIAADYKTASIDMEKWPRGVFTKWAQFVIYLTMDFQVKSTKAWKGKSTEAKVSDDIDERVERIIYTENHPSHDAKNRLGLPVSIPMGNSAQEAYKNLTSHFPPRIQEHLNVQIQSK